MDETEVLQEEQTEQESEQELTTESEPEQESEQTTEAGETQAEADNRKEIDEAETDTPETGQSNGVPESATQTEQVVIADFGNLEELTAETNALLVEQNALLANIHDGIVSTNAILGFLLGMLAVVIFGGAMNHDHK
ncbi:MAG: hypothetical protein HDQ98_05815 [Lachnospiraceae bacterium]|nr:hypothetical protein [Lachnospiraceae bacterium]